MIIQRFKILEHFINKDFNIECGIYEIETKTCKNIIVQTKNDYKALVHTSDTTELLNINKKIIEEIKQLLKENRK